VLHAIRSDVEVAARLASEAGELDVANAIDGLGRRLDVAVELRRRELTARAERKR
jgi:hypothetical protein